MALHKWSELGEYGASAESLGRLRANDRSWHGLGHSNEGRNAAISVPHVNRAIEVIPRIRERRGSWLIGLVLRRNGKVHASLAAREARGRDVRFWAPAKTGTQGWARATF